MRSFILDNLNLGTGVYKVEKTDVFSSPTREIYQEDFAIADGGTSPLQRWDSRTIMIEGYILADSETLADKALDKLKSLMLPNKTIPLQVEMSGGQRIYNVMPVGLPVKKASTDVGFCRHTWKFVALNPIGFSHDLVLNSASDTTYDDNPKTILSVASSRNLGTYWVLPEITFNLTTPTLTDDELTADVKKYVEFGNASLGQFIRLTFIKNQLERVNNKPVLIDVLNEKLTIDGINTYASGVFPKFKPNDDIELQVRSNSTGSLADINFNFRDSFL